MADKQVARRVPGTVLSSSEVTSLRDLITEAVHAYELAAVTHLRAVQEAAEILDQDMRSIAEQEERAGQQQARELATARDALAAEETRAQVLAQLAAEAREAAATFLDRGALAYLRGTGDALTGAVQQHTAPDELAAAAFADAQKARIDLRVALLKLTRAHFDAQDWGRARDVLTPLNTGAEGPLRKEALALLLETYLEEAIQAARDRDDWQHARVSMAAAAGVSPELAADHALATQFLNTTTRLVQAALATGRTAEALHHLAVAREHLGPDYPGLRRLSQAGSHGRTLPGSCLQEFGGHRQPVQDVAFTPNGEEVVSVDGIDIKRWRTSPDGPGRLVATFPAQNVYRLARNTSLAVTTDGTMVKTADGTVAMQLDVAYPPAPPPPVQLSTHPRAVRAVPLKRPAPHNRVCAFSTSQDVSVRAWALRNLVKPVQVTLQNASGYSVKSGYLGEGISLPLRGAPYPPQWPLTEAISIDSPYPTSPGYGQVITRNTRISPITAIGIGTSQAGQKPRWVSIEPSPIVLSLTVSPTGRFVAWLNPSGQLAVVDTASTVTRYTFHVAASQTIFDAVEISPRDQLVIAAQGQTVMAWDIATGAQSFTLTFPGVIGAIAVSPNERMLAILSTTGAISLCDIKEQPSPVVIGNHGPVTSPCIAFSPDGTRLVTSGNHLIKIWGLA